MKDLEILLEDFSKTVVNKPEITIEGKGKGLIKNKGKTYIMEEGRGEKRG